MSEAQLETLNQDWKKKYDEVQKRMCQSGEYQKLQRELEEQKWKSIRRLFCRRNLLIMMFIIGAFWGLYALASYLDRTSGQTVWVERFFSVGFSGIFVTTLTMIFDELKRNAQIK